MTCTTDANGSNCHTLRELSRRVNISALLLLLLLSLTVGSAAVAGNLDRVTSFNIKAQTLEKALAQFGIQAHVQIVFASKVSMGQMRTIALKGEYTGRQALTNLLRGSSWRFVEDGNTAVIVSSARTSSQARGSYDEQFGGGQRKTLPRHEVSSAIATPDPPNKASSVGNKVSALQEVTVTGTHIRGAPMPSPLVRITREDIDRSGYSTIGDVIRSLPVNFGNTGPQTAIGSAPNENSSASSAPAPNLYGLGAESTLTLIDGQRLADDGTDGSVDVSLIPLSVIDHVDVLTGGASAIYGSDAVAGVVNIVLERDFSGAKTTVLGGGTADGGGTLRDIDQMVGKTWSSGEVLLDFESAQQDPILASQRTYTDSANSITTTLAGSSRSSIFVNARQDVGTISAFITGLYTHRTESSAFSNGPQYPNEEQNAAVHQFAANGGLHASLPSEWSLSVVGNFSEERTMLGTAYLGPEAGPPSVVLNEGLLRSVEATTNGPMLKLPSGTAHAAVGAGDRVETFNYTIGGENAIAPKARRTVKYAYGELEIPLLGSSGKNWQQSLTLDLSGRAEHYSDFGGQSVPRVGLVWIPVHTITVRGTWGKAFHAPSLFEMYGSRDFIDLPLADPTSPAGVSDVLAIVGGNPELKPETARTWTVGVDYASNAGRGLIVSVTYLDIAYRNRIGTIADRFTALTDPLEAPFVTRSPSEAYVENLLNSGTFFNGSGQPFDPASVPAVVNWGDINIASEDVFGADADVRYRKAMSFGEIEPFLNAALLDLRQRLVPGTEEVEISGSVFEPPKVRVRGGLSWVTRQWTVTAIANYSGSEINTYQAESPVSSWTTVDFNVAWREGKDSHLGGLVLTFSVQNVFNRDPPFVAFDEFVPGIHYDPLNANVLGRAIRAGASWTFL